MAAGWYQNQLGQGGVIKSAATSAKSTSSGPHSWSLGHGASVSHP